MNLVQRLRYESPGPNHIATEAADRIQALESACRMALSIMDYAREGCRSIREVSEVDSAVTALSNVLGEQK